MICIVRLPNTHVRQFHNFAVVEMLLSIIGDSSWNKNFWGELSTYFHFSRSSKFLTALARTVKVFGSVGTMTVILLFPILLLDSKWGPFDERRGLTDTGNFPSTEGDLSGQSLTVTFHHTPHYITLHYNFSIYWVLDSTRIALKTPCLTALLLRVYSLPRERASWVVA
jgi:hypothetical protein